MPTFDFTSPDGKSYSVEGPEGATAAQAFQILQQHLGEQNTTPSVGSDLLGVAKTAPQRIIAGLAGIPADLAHLYATNQSDPNPLGTEALGEKMGVYQAQTEPGKIAQKLVDFAPAAIGGPESLATKIATRIAAPAVASEIGKNVAGPYGEIAGTLIGAGGATAAARKFQEMAAARAVANAIPTGDELVKLGGDQFNQARAMDIAVKPDFAKNTAQDMRDALKDYDPEQIKPVLNAVGRMEDLYRPTPPNLYNTLTPVAPTPPVNMNDVEFIRKQLSGLRTSPDATLRTAAKTAQEIITKNQMGLTAADAISGNAPQYAQTIRDAVANYGAGKRSQIIQGKVNLADLNAGTAGSGANVDNATRQAIKQLARPINNTNVPVAKKLGFNSQEIAAIEKAATGTAIGNTARFLGKGAPTGIVSAAGGFGLGHMAGGPVGAVALPAASYIAKKIGDMSTKRAVAALDSLVRSRSPHAAQVAAQLPPQVIAQLPSKTQRVLRTLTISAPGIRQQIGQPVGQAAAQ